LAMSGIQYKMQQRIIYKIEKAGATSWKKAVTIEQANLNMQEELWLDYFAGDFLGKIKKTIDKKYYI
jgi:hypothetical protein